MHRPFMRRDFNAPVHFVAGTFKRREINCSKFLFLFFRVISKNIANWNKCKRIYCKECMSQIRANNN